MQQENNKQSGNIGRQVGGTGTVVQYGLPHAKGILIAFGILVLIGFMKGGKAKRMQRQETRVVNYDLSKFEKNIQESKKLLKGKRP